MKGRGTSIKYGGKENGWNRIEEKLQYKKNGITENGCKEEVKGIQMNGRTEWKDKK